MIVSRADIPYDVIVQYPNSFMKIPVANYLEELGIEPLPSQMGLVNGINNPKYRFGCAALSRRQGKTYIANVVGQVVALVPGSHVLIMAPNYSLSQISFDLQRSLIKKFGIEVIKDNAKDKVIELVNNSTIRIGSVNQVDSCVGRSYDLIIFDEAALTDGREAFNVALRPTLDKPNSKALFISTPRGKNNWFADFFDRGFREDFPEWFSVKATWKDNPRMTEEDVAEARRSMSEAEFRQEYEADFSIFEGKIWNLKDTCVTDIDSIDLRKCDVFAGLDLGFRDPTAMCVIAYNWDTETFYVVDEYLNNEKTTAGHAKEIQRLMDKWSIDFIYIDSANQQQRYDFAQEYDIPTMNAKKSVLDGIGYVASLADNDRIIVNKDCSHVLYAFDQYQWDSNANLQKEKPIHNDASHMADALRYALYSYKTNAGGF
ncbi:MAG: terminase large subunit domain-containing protein [Flavobacteriaceae bacterium]